MNPAPPVTRACFIWEYRFYFVPFRLRATRCGGQVDPFVPFALRLSLRAPRAESRGMVIEFNRHEEPVFLRAGIPCAPGTCERAERRRRPCARGGHQGRRGNSEGPIDLVYGEQAGVCVVPSPVPAGSRLSRRA